jgi:hypothetical protein
MKPPAEINAEVVLPSGDRIRWDSAAPNVENRPLSPTFTSESGKGFAAGSVTLTRPTERDWPELGLLNELILRTATGRTVYQGRAQGVPVSDTFQFDCDGWWSHGEQRTMTEVLIDRDLGRWEGPRLSRRTLLVALSNTPITEPAVSPDDIDKLMALRLSMPPSPASPVPWSEAWYDAGSSRVAAIYYDMISVSASGDFGFIGTATDELGTGALSTADLLTGTNSTDVDTFTPSTPARFGRAFAYRSGTANTAEKSMTLRKLTVVGDHGIPTVTHPEGTPAVTASEAIKYLASKYAPKWDVSGVQDTSYPIPHATWNEPITASDAIKQLNSYHLWKLGVWEDRRLEFAPYDLAVADWQVANGIDGVSVEYQGDTTENVFNGCSVTFTDFSGLQQRLTPEDTDDLKDEAEWIAANQWGDQAWLEITVSWPTTADDAVTIGNIALASANQAKRPSTITVPMHIKDINGSWWPSSYVRADQTILVTNQHTPVPRLITRASWSNHVLTITTDNAIDTMEAFNQRIGTALTANGLT